MRALCALLPKERCEEDNQSEEEEPLRDTGEPVGRGRRRLRAENVQSRYKRPDKLHGNPDQRH
jgi:hypothetical protein